MKTNIPEVHRPAKAAETLGVSVPTVYRMVREGLLQKIKIGSRATGIIGVRELIERQANQVQP